VTRSHPRQACRDGRRRQQSRCPGLCDLQSGQDQHLHDPTRGWLGLHAGADELADWGYGNKKAKRDYIAVDLFIEHPLSDKWYGRLDYTWSRSFGNTEGQVKSDIGQDDVSKTQDWDAAALMEYAGGYLANDRRHQLKGYGAYMFNDEWSASATLRIMSGRRRAAWALRHR
jgi:hypothetical protein